MAKKHPIGLGHAARLCQMSAAELCAFLAEGLPVVLASAEGFWNGAEDLRFRPREADVLEGFAREEAAKVLILTDTLRCPKGQSSQRIGTFIGWFYDHLARLIYAEAVDWRPVDKKQLRAYVADSRRTHAVDGPNAEWIMPSGPVYDRERLLYADVEVLDDGGMLWNAPRSWKEGFPHKNLKPTALCLTQSMQRLGLFSVSGLRAMAEVWGREALNDDMNHVDARTIIHSLLQRLDDEGLIQSEATKEDAQNLYSTWPFPMWDFDLRSILVPLEELEAERDRTF